MKENILITLMAILLGTNLLISQDMALVPPRQIDSLESLINAYDEDQIEKVSLLHEYARLNFYNQNYQTGFEAVVKARDIAEQLKYKNGQSMYHQSLAVFLGVHGLYEYHLEQARILSLQNNENLVDIELQFPAYYPPLENEKLILKLQPVANHFEKIGEKEILATILDKISWSHYYEGNSNELNNARNKFLEIYKEIGEFYPIILYLNYQMYFAVGTNNELAKKEIIQETENLISSIQDAESLGSLQFLLGNLYISNGQNLQATEHYLNAVEYYEATNDHLMMVETYGTLADLYNQLEMFPKQVDVLERRLKVLIDYQLDADYYGAYMSLAWSNYDQGDYNDALKYMNLVLQNALPSDKSNAEKEFNSLKAHIMMEKGNYHEAIPLFQEVLGKSLENYQYNTAQWEAYRLSYCYYKINEYEKAEQFALASDRYLDTGNLRLSKMLHLLLSEIYEAYGDVERSYENLQKFKDDVMQSQTSNISNMIMQTEIGRLLDKNQEKVAQLKKERFMKEQQNKTQRVWIFSIAGALISAIFLLWILYRNNQIKQRTNTQLENQKNEIENTLDRLKSTQKQLIHSEKMASLGELTAGIAHEIQNPLNFVNNFSEVSGEMIEEVYEEIESGDIDEAKEILQNLKGNIEKINHHGQRASGIVKSMLDHSRTTSGEKVKTDINTLCDEYLKLAYHGLRARDRSFNADYKTAFDENIEPIKIVPQDIGRVVLNMINNAFQATQEKAKSGEENYRPLVTVTTKKMVKYIEISISDNGPGISDEMKDKIFQPFFTTKPTGQGTGLGLSLSYDIVKAHGGEIYVVSNKRNSTKISFKLPYLE
jgi:signal transduction histidine kinase